MFVTLSPQQSPAKQLPVCLHEGQTARSPVPAAQLGATQGSFQQVCYVLPNLLPPTQGAVGWGWREVDPAGYICLLESDGLAASVGVDV